MTSVGLLLLLLSMVVVVVLSILVKMVPVLLTIVRFFVQVGSLVPNYSLTAHVDRWYNEHGG